MCLDDEIRGSPFNPLTKKIQGGTSSQSRKKVETSIEFSKPSTMVIDLFWCFVNFDSGRVEVK